MRIVKCLIGLVGAMAILNTPVQAQDSQSELQQCSRGWLAKDWPTVAVSCMSEALHQEQDPKFGRNAARDTRGVLAPSRRGSCSCRRGVQQTSQRNRLQSGKERRDFGPHEGRRDSRSSPKVGYPTVSVSAIQSLSKGCARFRLDGDRLSAIRRVRNRRHCWCISRSITAVALAFGVLYSQKLNHGQRTAARVRFQKLYRTMFFFFAIIGCGAAFGTLSFSAARAATVVTRGVNDEIRLGNAQAAWSRVRSLYGRSDFEEFANKVRDWLKAASIREP